MEIWTIKVECVFGCYLEEAAAKICEVQSTYELDDLCDFILESFDFDNDHMHEFFISRRPIRSEKATINDSTMLKKVFPTGNNNHLFMHFDFGDDWVFKITRSRKKTEFKDDISYPRVIEHIGKNPEQYPMYDEYN